MSGSSLLVRGGVDPAGRRCDILVVDGRVAARRGSTAPGGQSAPDGPAAPDSAGVPVLDAEGLVVAPGLVDLQVNGAAGIDLTTEPERMRQVAAELVRHGVTAFLPTLISSAPEARERALGVWAAYRAAHAEGGEGAVPLGLHFEGPMLAPSARGAHPEHRLVHPSLELVAGWSREAGVAMVTLAPELPGALEVIALLASRGVVVSLGHTAASSQQVQAGIAAGASCLTHLYNAMPALHHREPGPVGVALGGDVVASVIADGHHVDALVVEATWRALGPDRFLAVSDATAAFGMPDGPAVLGESDVLVSQGTVRLPDGTLAGSAASLADCVQTLVAMTECSLAEALRTATLTPARLIGDASRGHLEVGAHGDLVLLDPQAPAGAAVVATVVAGEVRHDVRTSAATEGR